MNQRKEEDTTEADFIIRSYTKTELARSCCPGLGPVFALQRLYRWMRKNTALTRALSEVNHNRYRHSFLKREIRLIVHYLGEPWTHHGEESTIDYTDCHRSRIHSSGVNLLI